MDLRPSAPTQFFSKHFMQISVLSWGTIQCTQIFFWGLFFHEDAPFKNRGNFSIFLCVLAHEFCFLRTKICFWKNIMMTSILRVGTITYSHTIFLHPFTHLNAHLFYESYKFLNVSSANINGYGAQSTNFFPQQNFFQPSYLVGEPSHILTPFFAPISTSTDLFLGITQIPQFVMC